MSPVTSSPDGVPAPSAPRPTMPVPSADDTGQSYWDGFYCGLQLPDGWSPTPNALLVDEVGALPPGSALDLGCGAGGDAIWLAERGWQVTAVDVSGAALDRAAEFAAQTRADGRIVWQRHDLTGSFPDGSYDVVSAPFLHSPVEHAGDRDAILRRAMSAVAPGGSLLVIGHLGLPHWMEAPPFDVHLPSNAEVLATLDPPPEEWTTMTDRTVTRDAVSPEGVAGTREDTVLVLRRAGRAARTGLV